MNFNSFNASLHSASTFASDLRNTVHLKVFYLLIYFIYF